LVVTTLMEAVRHKILIPADTSKLCELREALFRLSEEHGVPPKAMRRMVLAIDEALANVIEQQQQDAVELVPPDLFPGEQPVFRRQRLEDPGDVDRVEAIEELAELAEVLPVHEGLDQLVPRHLLAIDEVLDQPVARQQALHLLQVLGQPVEFGEKLFAIRPA